MIKSLNQLTKVKAMQLFQVFRQGAVILTSVFLAKTSLTAAEIGVYEILLFIGTTISFFWINGFLQAMLPIYPDMEEEDRKGLFFQSYLLFVGISLVLLLGLFIFEDQVVYLMAGLGHLPYFKPFVIFLVLNFPTYLVEYFYLLTDQPKRIVGYGALVFGLQVAAVLLPIFLGYGLLYSVYALIALAFLKHLLTIYILTGLGRVNWNPQILKQYLVLGMPLVAYAFIGGFSALFDKWLVGWFYNDEAVFAVFSYGARELPLSTALATAFSAALIPEIVKDQGQGLLALKQKSIKLYHILFPLSIALLLTSGWLFPIVFNASFIESAAVFNVYLLVVTSRLLFPQTVLIALRETNFILLISIIELVLNIFMSFLLIHRFGLVGIAMATVVAFLFEKIVIAIYLKQKHGIGLGQYTDFKYFIGYSTLLFLAYCYVC